MKRRYERQMEIFKNYLNNPKHKIGLKESLQISAHEVSHGTSAEETAGTLQWAWALPPMRPKFRSVKQEREAPAAGISCSVPGLSLLVTLDTWISPCCNFLITASCSAGRCTQKTAPTSSPFTPGTSAKTKSTGSTVCMGLNACVVHSPHFPPRWKRAIRNRALAWAKRLAHIGLHAPFAAAESAGSELPFFLRADRKTATTNPGWVAPCTPQYAESWQRMADTFCREWRGQHGPRPSRPRLCWPYTETVWFNVIDVIQCYAMIYANIPSKFRKFKSILSNFIPFFTSIMAWQGSSWQSWLVAWNHPKARVCRCAESKLFCFAWASWWLTQFHSFICFCSGLSTRAGDRILSATLTWEAKRLISPARSPSRFKQAMSPRLLGKSCCQCAPPLLPNAKICAKVRGRAWDKAGSQARGFSPIGSWDLGSVEVSSSSVSSAGTKTSFTKEAISLFMSTSSSPRTN